MRFSGVFHAITTRNFIRDLGAIERKPRGGGGVRLRRGEVHLGDALAHFHRIDEEFGLLLADVVVGEVDFGDASVLLDCLGDVPGSHVTDNVEGDVQQTPNLN